MELDEKNKSGHEGCLPKCLASRRQFLLTGGAAAALILTGLPGMGSYTAQAVTSKYPRRKIGGLKALKEGKPMEFLYPSKDIENILVKLGTPAGGGVGPDKDVVAFNPVCTHMGGPLGEKYNAQYKILGQCPFHQSTFDLTRHGMIVSGHGTESLPQVLLETEGDDIYATGFLGLVYGRNSNV
jgi:arsenite oxidase small subunit